MKTLSITGQIFVKSLENCSDRLRKGQLRRRVGCSSIPVLAGTGLHGEGGAVRVIGVTEQYRTETEQKRTEELYYVGDRTAADGTYAR